MLQVLLVDDDANQLRIREMLLRTAGIQATLASTADEALRRLRSLRGSIGAVVTDHNLPERSGAELVRELRRTEPSLPVMVLSGMPGIDAEYEGLEAVIQIKPLPAGQFIEMMRHLLKA